MKHKFSSMGRVAIALVLALSLSLVMAAPVSAANPSIGLDEPWYGIGDTVTVTVVDAAKNVPESVTDELAALAPSGNVFTVAHDIIVDPEETAVVKNQVGATLTLDEATPHPTPDNVQVVEAQVEEIKYINAAVTNLAQLYNLTIAEQPYKPLNTGDLADQRLSLSLALQPAASQTVAVTLGLINAVGGGFIFTYEFDEAYLGGTPVEVPGTVGSIDYVQVTPSAAQEDQTFTLSSTNAVWVSYDYHVVNTVDVMATSPSDDPLTLTLDEGDVNTGSFVGTFVVVAAEPDVSQLQVAHGDTITVSYEALVETAEVDAEAPTITSLTPKDEFVITTTPTISAVLADLDSGLDEATIALTVDGTPIILVTDYDFDSDTGELSFTPGEGKAVESLVEGDCEVIVAVDDNVGNSGTETWVFTVDTVAPTAPTALTAETMPKRIDLGWVAAIDETSGLDHYNIYRSITEGVTGDYLDSSVTNLYRDATGDDGVTYYYVVTAVDKATNEGPASDEAGAIFSAEYVEQTFASDLIGGWNYISLPIIPIESNVTAVLASVEGSYSQVWAYEGQEWQVFIPGEPDEYYTGTGLTKLVKMVDGLGYIIDMDGPASWTGMGIDEKPGAVVPPCYAVAKGWNLIGFKTMDFNDDDKITQDDSMKATYYLKTIDVGTIEYLRYFDRGTVTFQEVDLATHEMWIGHGYWLYVTVAGEIAPPIVPEA